MDVKFFHNEVTVRHRALLTNAEDVATLGNQAQVITTNWYDEPIPVEVLVNKAKEFNKDTVTIETQTTVERSFYVET